MLDQMMKMLEGQQIGPYRLNKFLGAGGFGGVFHASEMVRNTSVQEVAVKVIPESSDDKLIELTNARKLEHSNLIKAYSVGEFTFLNTEMLYLVMELAQGSLENHIAKGGLSSSEIKNIAAQVAQGLNYLHGQNKVHRDLKPGNILKVNQQYKLADFGLIRTLNNNTMMKAKDAQGLGVVDAVFEPADFLEKSIAFAKQGAVSGSARLKKLVSDTVTMNGSSFYSARGAEEANLGRYQGTNISGNYYLKNKPVTNSCLGTIPTAPIVFITENDTYSITFSWREIGNSFCGVEYYTVTYYAIDIIERIRNIEDIVYIDDMKYTQDVQETLDIHDTQEFLNINEAVSQTGQHIFSKNTIINDDTIYTDSENNIKFKVASEIKNIIVAPDPTKIITTHIISSLNSETNYFVSMTSTNGNGTSIRSNNVLTNTLFDSNIKIMIDASSNTFRYNSSNPVTLTVTLSSLHSDTPISLAIIESSRKEVAEITKVTGTANTYKVSLNNTGTFKFNAKQERDSNKVTIYGTSVARSLIITVNKDTPLFSTSWNAFPTLNTSSTIYIGSVLTITAPSILSPSSVFTEILPIRYTFTSNDDGIITITHDDISTQAYIRVNKIGKFRIIGNTIESDRFETTKITSEIEYNTDRSSPLIAFPNFDKEITFGQQPYTLVPVSFTRPTKPAAAGIWRSRSPV